jgi:hypothetical protein
VFYALGSGLAKAASESGKVKIGVRHLSSDCSPATSDR